MIKQYRDHAANERTYLAWIRTAVTVMAFGVLVEKIDLFFLYIGRQVGYEDLPQPSLAAELIGVSLFLSGIIVIVISTIRFFIHQKAIDADETIIYHNRSINILFSGFMIVFTASLFILLIIKIFP